MSSFNGRPGIIPGFHPALQSEQILPQPGLFEPGLPPLVFFYLPKIMQKPVSLPKLDRFDRYGCDVDRCRLGG